jgi:hypothetical protein
MRLRPAWIQTCAFAQSDQYRCCSLTNPIASRETDIEQHGSWSDCMDAQTGLDPCCSQTHYVCFVMTRLNNWNSVNRHSQFKYDKVLFHCFCLVFNRVNCKSVQPRSLHLHLLSFIWKNIFMLKLNIKNPWHLHSVSFEM